MAMPTVNAEIGKSSPASASSQIVDQPKNSLAICRKPKATAKLSTAQLPQMMVRVVCEKANSEWLAVK